MFGNSKSDNNNPELPPHDRTDKKPFENNFDFIHYAPAAFAATAASTAETEAVRAVKSGAGVAVDKALTWATTAFKRSVKAFISSCIAISFLLKCTS